MSNADLQYLYSSCINENKAQYYGVYSTVLSNEPDISNEDSRRKMYDDLKNTFCEVFYENHKNPPLTLGVFLAVALW